MAQIKEEFIQFILSSCRGDIIELFFRYIDDIDDTKNIDEVLNYIVNNDLLDKLKSILIINNYDRCRSELLHFAVYYGILSLTKFMYINENVQCDIPSTILEHNINLSSQQPNRQNIVATTNSANTHFNARVLDKFSVERNECYKFLLEMRRYSTYTFYNKKYLYKFNQKYINHIS